MPCPGWLFLPLFKMKQKPGPSLTIFLFLLMGFNTYSQDITVSFKIANKKKEPVAYASFRLVNRNDSNQVFTRSADSLGKVKFELKKGGQYDLTITAANYQPIDKGILVRGDQSQFQFVAEPLEKIMEGVVVRSRKPLMKQEEDKLIIDPENLVAASSNGYEVIEKTPGLFVDQDGNIYISSLTPASVQINGRDLKMSAADMATMLKNLPPNAIQKIEVVKTPSARYDASGGGGIVNVVLKKGVKIGMTGSVNTGWQQGKYGNGNIGVSLNNNTGKRNYNFNLSYNRRNNYERIYTDRIFATDSLLRQDANTVYPGNAFYSSFSITWQLNKKWELTYDAEGNYNNFNNRSNNLNLLLKNSTNSIFSNSLNTVNNHGHSLSYGTGFETKYKIDSIGSEWTNDTYIRHSEDEGNQVFLTNYSLPQPFSFGGDGINKSSRNFFTGRSDLKLKWKKKVTLETGLQSTILGFKNHADYYREQSGTRTKDNARTNRFEYNQNINSLYLQGTKTFNKDLVLKLGARLENTNMDGRQLVPGDTSFAIHRTDLFPYIYLSKPLMKIMSYELRAYLVYRRSIRRPGYDQLNPYARYVDQYLTETGNPALRPQFTNNYEVNVSVDERPILAFGLNDTKDIFTNVVYQADSSRSQAYRTYDNLGTNKELYFRAIGALPPGGKYFIVLGTQYNHNHYEGIYEGKPLSFSRGTWSFFTYQTLRLDNRSVLSLNGFVRFRGQQQFYELSSFGALNLSLNRKFIKDKLIITLSGNDILRTNKNDFLIRQGSVNATGFRISDSRRFGMNIRYAFGVKKKEEKKFLDVEQE